MGPYRAGTTTSTIGFRIKFKMELANLSLTTSLFLQLLVLFPMTRLPITLTTSSSRKDIHAVVIQDKVRTSTYASFILTNPILFRDAVVLDVGCGTGIHSCLAAKSGAMHVYAVDASDIAEKAERIVRANGPENDIT
jgi:2-polyprenyl-3-methyl-5-hydroxy-6-metoxy-1,4-benzoquinol methylase